MSEASFGGAARVQAAGIHLLISVIVAMLTAGVLFSLWFPGAFRAMAGGQSLYVLLVSVDICLGPLLTLAVFDVRKERRELRLDLAVIGLVQVVALAYGLHAVYVARPVAMVYEVDRFRLVTATDIAGDDLAKASSEYRDLPRLGPWLLGTRAPLVGAEQNEVIFTALKGRDIGSRPQFWQPYDASIASALSRSRPVVELFTRYPSKNADFRTGLREMDVSDSRRTASCRWLRAATGSADIESTPETVGWSVIFRSMASSDVSLNKRASSSTGA